MVASAKAEIKLNASMEYNPPGLVDLIERAKKSVRVDYKRDNPSRLELISLLEITHENIANRHESDHKLMLSDNKDICLGAWVYCIESIANEYRLTNPSFKGGYLFNSGSTLYKILLNNLGITKDHQMTEKAKLHYLCKFYNFLFIDKHHVDSSVAISQLFPIRKSLIEMMQSILLGEQGDQDRILKAIPSEKSIDLSMIKLYQDYVDKAKYVNAERIVLAKLAVAVCEHNVHTHPKDNKEIAQMLPRSARVKIGMLIYIMESINDSYILRKPKENSVLYTLCDKALGNSYHYIDSETRLACLMALELYLNNDKNREALEIYINKAITAKRLFVQPVYIDPILRPIVSNISKMVKKLVPNESKIPVSNVTLSAAVLGGLIGSAPGYGAGYAFGYGVSLTDQVGARKNLLSGTTGYAMNVMLGTSSCYYGYYAADIVVTAGVERLFAKIFEALGAILGAAGAGAISFVIYDLSLTTALQLCKLCLHLNKNLQPGLIKESDLLFITTLLELPPEVFSDINKDKLRRITDVTVATSGLGLLSHSSQVPPLKVSSEPEEASPQLVHKK